MTTDLEKRFVWLTLLLVGIVPVFLGGFAPFVLIVAVGVFFLAFLLKNKTLKFRTNLMGATFVGVFFIQMILAILTAKAPGDIVFGLNFLPLFLYVFAEPVLAGARLKDPVRLFANFSLAGSLTALIISVFLIDILHYDRGYYGPVNTNDLSGLALLFGFLALVGLSRNKPAKTAYLLLGPIAALATIFITESRGALLAYGAMLFVSVFILAPKRFRLAGALTLVALLFLAVLALAFVVQDSRILALPQIVQGVISGTEVSDFTSNIRLVLYSGGIQAFLDEPLFGHGWAHFMQAAAGHIPDAASRELFVVNPQLHNDLINFAAAGGIVGILSYLACLLAPLFVAFGLPDHGPARATRFGIILLVTCYGVRGLTDLMIGFEYGTSYFVIVLALLMSFSSQSEPEPVRQDVPKQRL